MAAGGVHASQEGPASRRWLEADALERDWGGRRHSFRLSLESGGGATAVWRGRERLRRAEAEVVGQTTSCA